jgi:hypothetical protein
MERYGRCVATEFWKGVLLRKVMDERACNYLFQPISDAISQTRSRA